LEFNLIHKKIEIMPIKKRETRRPLGFVDVVTILNFGTYKKGDKMTMQLSTAMAIAKKGFIEITTKTKLVS